MCDIQLCKGKSKFWVQAGEHNMLSCSNHLVGIVTRLNYEYVKTAKTVFERNKHTVTVKLKNVVGGWS